MARYIYNAESNKSLGIFRGEGRIIQTLKERFEQNPNVFFTSSLNFVKPNDEILIPTFNPFTKPILNKRIAKKQSIMIFDVIPLKYPHHFPVGIKGWINLQLNKFSLQFFDEIITISYTSKNDLVRYLNINQKKIIVEYPQLAKIFSDCKTYSNKKSHEHGKTSNSNYLVYVGDVNWNKNLVNLAKAIKIAKTPCVFIGKMFDKQVINSHLAQPTTSHHPWLSEYIKFLYESHNNSLFIFKGYLSDHELIKHYQSATANILVSRDEGYGYSYKEARSQGCRSILSDIGVFREIAKNDHAVTFVEPEKPENIAEGIKTVCGR